VTYRTVADLVAELLAVEARAAAVEAHRKELRSELEDRARAEHVLSGALPRWSVPGAGTASWCERKGTMHPADLGALLGWVEATAPEMIERAVSPVLLNTLAKTCAVTPDGRVVTPGGELVPGLAVTEATHYLSVRLDREAKARAVAELAVDTGSTVVADLTGAWAAGEAPDLDLDAERARTWATPAPEERW
jgi:hypothetical protein